MSRSLQHRQQEKPAGGTKAKEHETGSSSREAAFAMPKTLTETMASLAFINIHTEVLEMSPIPAVCVLGRKAGLAP